VPEDVSVVGFDDHPLAALVTPALTTVRQDFVELGRRSVRLLVDQMTSKTDTRFISTSTELVIRESTAPPPGA
jgi:DNA-binding LacI/PurR family transcriptional regulator